MTSVFFGAPAFFFCFSEYI